MIKFIIGIFILSEQLAGRLLAAVLSSALPCMGAGSFKNWALQGHSKLHLRYHSDERIS